MSKIGQAVVKLDEEAQALGFSGALDAMMHGYTIKEDNDTLVLVAPEL